MRLTDDTPLYKYVAMVYGDPCTVFARDVDEADRIVAAVVGLPQSEKRQWSAPTLRGGLYEFTWSERVRELRTRQASRRRALSGALEGELRHE